MRMMQGPEWDLAQQLAQDSAPDHFGHVRGFDIGHIFSDRKTCCNAGVHRHTQAGIVGTPLKGCYSVVVSGQYEDDEDMGDTILYTGVGGRDDGTKRQTGHQDMGRPENAALERSMHTGQPIRVIRSIQLQRGPKGYRYDGLYRVVEAKETKGKSGYKICQFRLERCAEQPSLPT